MVALPPQTLIGQKNQKTLTGEHTKLEPRMLGSQLTFRIQTKKTRHSVWGQSAVASCRCNAGDVFSSPTMKSSKPVARL
jgi:hypothetical protein